MLNRPTANVVQFNLPRRPRRCIGFGGEARVRSSSLQTDSNGLLWLHRRPELGGTRVGQLDVWRIGAAEAAESIRGGRAALRVRGVHGAGVWALGGRAGQARRNHTEKTHGLLEQDNAHAAPCTA